MPTIDEVVEAGAEWLDERIVDWAEQIDVGDLEMEANCHCILGQLFGAFDRFVGVYTFYDWPTQHGFDAPWNVDYDASWSDLEDEWLKQIKKRINGGPDAEQG